MAKVSVAGWIRQDPQSSKQKVYGALTWIDAGGQAQLITLYGPAHNLGHQMAITDQRSTRYSIDTANDAVARFAKSLSDKEGKGYSVQLGGPTVLDLDDDLLTRPNEALYQFNHAAARMTAATAAETAHSNARTTAYSPVATTQAPPRTSVAAASNVQPVILPDGGMYYPRLIAGIPDVELLASARKSGLLVRLEGPPGSGKTTLPAAVFPDMVTVQAHGDLTVADLVGKYVPDNASASGFSWRDGPLTTAMLEGKVLLVDEVTRAPAETLAAFLSATDDRRSIVIDDQPGRVVQAATGFYVVLTYNPTGQGVRPLDDALKRRFPLSLTVRTDFEAAARRGVSAKLIAVARNLQTKSVQAVANGEWETWVPQMGTLLSVQRALDAGLGDQIATGMLLGACTDEDDSAVIDTISLVYGFEAGRLELGAAA